jgi:membrane-associated phospholipid phosphatase
VARLNDKIDNGLMNHLGQHQNALNLLAALGEPFAVTLLCLTFVIAGMAARRIEVAALAAIAIPVAPGLTEYVLKPLFRTPAGATVFPSGHTTAAFSIATVLIVAMVGARRSRLVALRVVTVVAAVIGAVIVAIAVVALDLHNFIEAVGGAAVGVGVVLAVALFLDLPAPHRLLAALGQKINRPQRQTTTSEFEPERAPR